MMRIRFAPLHLGAMAALALTAPAALISPTALAAIGDPAGIAGAVSGDVGRVSPAKAITSPIALASGDGILMGDGISTGVKSRLQIMLLDQSAITLGPEAELTIDEFVFDPADTDANLLAASLAKGAFRLITGGIARENPDGTTLKLPNATLAVRGTTVTGSCDASGCIVALAGSGAANNAGKKASRVVVTSGKGRVELKRPGFFVEIAPDGSLSTPAPLPDDIARDLAVLFDPLGPGLPSNIDRRAGAPASRSILDGSGQRAQEGGPLSLTQQTIDLVSGASQPALTGTTTNLALGQAHYNNVGSPLAFAGPSGNGTYSIDYLLDLQSRTFSGNLYVTLNAPALSGTFPLLVDPFLNNFTILESGFLTDPTLANDTVAIKYTIGAGSMATDFQYDVDGIGTTNPSTGAGAVPLVP